VNLIEQLSAIILLITFLAGLSAGVLGCAVYASVLENASMSLLRPPADPVVAGVRVMLGLFTRDDGYLRGIPPRGQGARESCGQGRDR
jgi:hypothetical protein